MNNGHLKGMDLALAMRVGAGHLMNAAVNAQGHQPAFSIFCELSNALDAMAESLERQYARPEKPEPGASPVRSEKEVGDVVIGSVCAHVWESDLQGMLVRCNKCKEKHAPDCNATLPFPGRCECGESQPPQN